ncbi:MAG: dephospho-CoA kinase [Leptospiraceae bacterium]|jgi:dephospho-CoA kinase|nr:dephospho-CoA kinase [Leptospiraceae bacterium]
MNNLKNLFNLEYEKVPEKFPWKKNSYLIGLTGTLAAGKSTASEIFKNHHCTVLNADDIAKKMYLRPEIKKIIIDKFGEESYDGTDKVNLKYLSKKIFSKKENVQWINHLLHPLVKEEIKQYLKNAKTGEIILYDVPLLFESNSHKENDYDLIIVVDAPIELRKKRAFERNQWTEEEFMLREKNQMDPSTKKMLANCVLWNDQDKETLEKKILYLIEQIQKNQPKR